MAYYVKKLDHNVYNQYKYHYLDHMCCVIDMRQNYWTFAVDLFSINDFNMPINSIAGNLQLPYQTVENIAFNLSSDQSYAKESVEHNKEYAHLYTSTFNVDISQNELFKQDLENVKLNFDLNLFIDPEAAKGAGSAIDQETLDALINETSEQRWSFEMYYSNTYKIQQQQLISNVVSYELPFGHTCIPTTTNVELSSDNLTNIISPFDSLIEIASETDFQIISAKVKFNYWIELETQMKTLEKVLDVDKKPNKIINICLNDNTAFNYETNEVIFDPIGAKGFYIPKYSQGYYEIELQILQQNVMNKFVLTNNFNFIKNEGKPYIGITHKLIDNIDDFKEVIF